MKLRNKIVSTLTVAALIATTFSTTAFAATDDYVNGTYSATVHMYKADSPSDRSMCDPIFDYDADVVLSADETEITVYVAYPIPAFSSLGVDGTLLDVVATVDGTTYTADLDTTSLPSRQFDESSALFGTTAGVSYPTEVITFNLPADAITAATSDGIYLSAYVNSVMNSTQYFYMKLSAMTLIAGESSADANATETSEQSVTVTADVEKNTPSYTVTVPASVALGTLSKVADTTVSYNVEVEANNFDGESVEVVATSSGKLVSDANENNTIAFTNDFGSQTVTKSATLSGNIKVNANDVASAKSGNYTGTTSFVINYFAAEE